MTVWTEPTECSLCGTTGRDIHYQLVEWLDALPGMKWSHVARCDDRAGCRARVQTKGETYPVAMKGTR
jgi:hypothetical protein